MPDRSLSDVLQVAQRALAKANGLEDELDSLVERVDELEEELTAHELRLSEFDEDRSYHVRSLDDKIGKVREHAYRRATDGTGRAKLDYQDVMWSVFDGEPGAKHCYKLLRLAAGEDEATQRDFDAGVRGFRVRDPPDGNFHLAVDAERARRTAAFCPENKAGSEGVR